MIVAVAGPAAAQNYDGDTVIKFGAFGQGTFLNFGVTQPLAGSSSANGVVGGLSVAIDYHPSRYYLFGVELDGSLGDARGTFNNTSYGFDYLMQLRGRFGVYPHPDWLIYGTAGVGYLGFEAQRPGVGNKNYETLTGLTVGFGLEYHWHHVILFGEYSYGTFGAHSFKIDDVRHETDADAHLVRLGIKFKVGHDYHQDIGRHYDPLK